MKYALVAVVLALIALAAPARADGLADIHAAQQAAQ